MRSIIDKIDRRIKRLECKTGSGNHLERPLGVPQGWIAVVDATGNDIEWVPPVTTSKNTQMSLTAGQSVYTLPTVATDPASSVLIYDNHSLMYGIGYVISGTQLTFLTNSDWQIEAGEQMHIVYN